MSFPRYLTVSLSPKPECLHLTFIYVIPFSQMLGIQLSLKPGSRYSLLVTIAFPTKLNVSVHLWKFNPETFIPLPTNKLHREKRFFRDEYNSELKNSQIYHILLLFLIRE